MIYSSTQLFLIYSGLFFGVLVFSLMIDSLFMRFARTLGMRDRDPMMVRWSSTHKPAFGGIGFYMLFLVSFTIYGVLFPGQREETQRPELLGLLGATSLGFLMGLADDSYNTRPLLKFAVQLICGGMLIMSGTSIQFFDAYWANVLLTLLWVVGMMNSINMLDNMDGITTVVSIMILIAAIVVQMTLAVVQPVYMVLLIGVIASLSGFLFHNWHPSRMYMGDTGSQFLGVFLAFMGIRFFWNAPSPAGELEPARQLLAAVIAFLLPIVDTTVVSIRRISGGRSPFIGGRDHTTHHLSYAGLSDGQVALVFAGVSLVNIFLTFVMFRHIPDWGNIHTFIFVSYCLIIFGTFFVISQKTRPPVQ